jgi:hypothetical protein
MDDFWSEGGRAMYLGTEYGGLAYRLYEKRGFVPIEPGSGTMARWATDRVSFESHWFGVQSTAVRPLDWCDWIAATPLLTGDAADSLRAVGVGLLGRTMPEEAFLPLLQAEEASDNKGQRSAAVVLRGERGAVLGFAAQVPDRIWRGRNLLDIYCHPQWWDRAAELVDAVAPTTPCASYVEPKAADKKEVLAKSGFHHVATLPAWWRDRDVEVWCQ